MHACETNQCCSRCVRVNIYCVHLEANIFSNSRCHIKMAHEKLLAEYPYLTEDLFESILVKPPFDYKDLRIVEFNVVPALKPGENYGSQIIRAAVKFTHSDVNAVQTKTFIIKANCGVSRSVDVFAKESFIFEEVIPKVEQLLRKVGIDTKIGPQ